MYVCVADRPKLTAEEFKEIGISLGGYTFANNSNCVYFVDVEECKAFRALILETYDCMYPIFIHMQFHFVSFGFPDKID